MKTALSVIRARCNYSQAILAETIGVSRQLVCAWENGSKKLPDNRIAELAALFGVPSAILKENDLEKVEQWCDRPMFSAEIHGRQVFSFEPSGCETEIFLTSPNAPMPAARSRELAQKRNLILQNFAAMAEVRTEQQSKDLRDAEICISILERIQSLLDCAKRSDPQVREQMMLFVLEQLSILEQVFAGSGLDRAEPTQWQTQQLQQLRSHWAQVNRAYRANVEKVSKYPPVQSGSEGKYLSERLNELYHYAMAQGANRRDLQFYLNQIIMEEYDDER